MPLATRALLLLDLLLQKPEPDASLLNAYAHVHAAQGAPAAQLQALLARLALPPLPALLFGAAAAAAAANAAAAVTRAERPSHSTTPPAWLTAFMHIGRYDSSSSDYVSLHTTSSSSRRHTSNSGASGGGAHHHQRQPWVRSSSSSSSHTTQNEPQVVLPGDDCSNSNGGSSSSSYCTSPGLPARPSLITLPQRYQDLYLRLSRLRCAVCGAEPGDTGMLCLVTGRCVAMCVWGGGIIICCFCY
jgi:Proteolysis_6 C-terminal